MSVASTSHIVEGRLPMSRTAAHRKTLPPVGHPTSFRVSQCSHPRRDQTQNPRLASRTDLDMVQQVTDALHRTQAHRLECRLQLQQEVERVMGDSKFRSYGVCALLVEGARYQREQGSTALNEYVHHISNIGRGAEAGCAVPSSTLRVIMRDCTIIHQHYGIDQVVRALSKLPLWSTTAAFDVPSPERSP